VTDRDTANIINKVIVHSNNIVKSWRWGGGTVGRKIRCKICLIFLEGITDKTEFPLGEETMKSRGVQTENSEGKISMKLKNFIAGPGVGKGNTMQYPGCVRGDRVASDKLKTLRGEKRGGRNKSQRWESTRPGVLNA